MSDDFKDRLFCVECLFQFGSGLAKFSTISAFYTHSSIVHNKTHEDLVNEDEPETEQMDFDETRILSESDTETSTIHPNIGSYTRRKTSYLKVIVLNLFDRFF